MLRVFLLALAASAVVACQSNTIGSGPISFSPSIERHFKRYMESSDPVSYYAVAVDGRSGASFFYCPDVGCRSSNMMEAIYSCEETSDGVPCKIYASRKEVLWKFNETKPAVDEDLKTSPSYIAVHWKKNGTQAYYGVLNEGQKPGRAASTRFSLRPSGNAGMTCKGTVHSPYSREPSFHFKCPDGVGGWGDLDQPVNAGERIVGKGVTNKGDRITFEVDHSKSVAEKSVVVRPAKIDWAILDRSHSGELRLEKLKNGGFTYKFTASGDFQCTGKGADWYAKKVDWKVECNDGSTLSGVVRASANNTYFGTGYDQDDNHLFLSLDPPVNE